MLAASLATIAVPCVVRAVESKSIASKSTVRFGTTPVFLDDQLGLISRWRAYLSHAIEADVQFVQRRNTARSATS